MPPDWSGARSRLSSSVARLRPRERRGLLAGNAVPGLTDLVDRHLEDLEGGAEVFGAELVLEGLHQHAVLAKEISIGGTVFTDMVSQMFEDFDDGRRKRRSR